MWRWIRRLVASPTFEGDPEKTSAAALVNVILLLVLIGVILFVSSMVFTGEHVTALVRLIVAVLCVVDVGLLVLVRRGRVRAASLAVCGLLWVSFTLPIYAFGGIHDAAVTGYFVVTVLAGVSMGGKWLGVFGLLSLLSLSGAHWAEQAGWIVPSIEVLSDSNDFALVMLVLGAVVIVLRYALRRLAGAYSQARETSEELAESNRRLVEHRDQALAQAGELEQRARYLEAVTRISREAASFRQVQDLLDRAAGLVTEQLGYYHTGIFLLDPVAQWAELRAVTSPGGRRMVTRGHRLRVGSQGIVGTVAESATPRIALDVGEDAVFWDNPDLPETRSEVALPLRTRDRVIGVLDVQSTEAQAFDEGDVGVLQVLADQLAVAIDNAQLFERQQTSIQAERRAYGVLTREAWRDLVRSKPDLGYVKERGTVVPVDQVWEPAMQKAVQSEATVQDDDGSLALPIKVGDTVVAVLEVRQSRQHTRWGADEIALLESLCVQLAQAMERVRLYQETQLAADRERLVGQITARIRSSLDVETMLRTAVDEMQQSLGLDRVAVHLATADGATKVVEPGS